MEIKKPDYLFVKIRGMRSVDTIKKGTEKIAEKWSKQKCSKLLVDIKGYDFNKEFFENIAVNRGHNVKIFTDVNNAIDCLS